LDENKKVISKMKDEANGNIVERFVGLAPKLYSFKGRAMRKVAAKGIKNSLIRTQLKHEMFADALMMETKPMC
jgi:hypothetical protein